MRFGRCTQGMQSAVVCAVWSKEGFARLFFFHWSGVHHLHLERVHVFAGAAEV